VEFSGKMPDGNPCLAHSTPLERIGFLKSDDAVENLAVDDLWSLEG
jgi:hypothetical protein